MGVLLSLIAIHILDATPVLWRQPILTFGTYILHIELLLEFEVKTLTFMGFIFVRLANYFIIFSKVF